MESDKSASFPVTLGKPSLRRRLEAYYSLVAPFLIEDVEEWRKRFDQIYEKYGGSVDGEQKLALKLKKKYGSAILLRVAAPKILSSKSNAPSSTSNISSEIEESYRLTEEELTSTDINFLSNKFNPIVALQSKLNPIDIIPDRDAPILDNISKARSILPQEDPLRFVAPERKQVKQPDNVQKVPLFDRIIAQYENSGPLSVLWNCQMKRQRIRVLIRYVNCVRGTITGFLKAFDKHFNLILQDADECYSTRFSDYNYGEGSISNSEIEMKRRKCSGKILNDKFVPTGSKLRHCKLILVRGDNVVSIWRVESEHLSTTFYSNE